MTYLIKHTSYNKFDTIYSIFYILYQIPYILNHATPCRTISLLLMSFEQPSRPQLDVYFINVNFSVCARIMILHTLSIKIKIYAKRRLKIFTCRKNLEKLTSFWKSVWTLAFFKRPTYLSKQARLEKNMG